VLGLPAKPEAGQPLAALLAPCAGPALDAALAPFQQPGGGTAHWTSPDGRRLEVTAEPLGEGRVLGLWRDMTRQQEAEASLAEARVRTSHLLRHVTDCIVLLDADGVILENSDRSGRLLDLPPELVRPGGTHQEILRHMYRRGDYGFDVPEDVFVAERRARILAAGELTFATLMPNGVWAEYNFRPRPDGYLLVVVRDVTALKEAQATLEAERATMRTVIDNLGDGVMLFDRDFRWRIANRPMVEFQGFPAELARPGADGRALLRFQARRGDFGAPPADDAALEAMVEEAAQRMLRPGGNRYVRRTADGRWIEFTMLPLPDGGLLACYRDITRLKDQEEALEAERVLLRRVLDGMQDAVVLLDPDGAIVETNGKAPALFGIPPELMEPGSSHQAVQRWRYRRGEFGFDRPEDAVVEARWALVKAAEGPLPLRLTPNGKWVENQFRTLPSGQILATCRDMTAVKLGEQAALAAKAEAEAARDAAEAAARAKATFLAAMSHEIRTPMNGVLGMMEILERSALSGEQARSVAIMRDSAQSLLRIIDDILDFSKIDAGRMEVEELPFS
ncbi:MAG: PAS domain-containing protein, partial [Acetobacteraceae bacterium]